jgi:hypothetical protein
MFDEPIGYLGAADWLNDNLSVWRDFPPKVLVAILRVAGGAARKAPSAGNRTTSESLEKHQDGKAQKREPARGRL